MKKIRDYFNIQRVILILLVIALHGNTLKNGYALDDSAVTEPNNITAKGIKAIPKILQSFYLDKSDDAKFEYRPLVKISFAIEHELFGVHAGVSHFFNLVFYLMGLFLLQKLLVLLFNNYDKQLIFFCVLLFAIMPIHTEVVASLKNRDILLCFIFCMIGFKNYLLFFESPVKNGRY